MCRAHPAVEVRNSNMEEHIQDPSDQTVMQAKSLCQTEMQVMMTSLRARSPDLSRLLCRRRPLRQPIAVSVVFCLHHPKGAWCIVLSGITLGESSCKGKCMS